MVIVKLGRPGFEYDVHSLVKAFFGEEDVKVSADEGKIAEWERKNEVSLLIEIIYDGDASEFPTGRALRDTLKRQVYRQLSAYLGRTLPWGTLTGVRPVKIAGKLLGQGLTEGEAAAEMSASYFASSEKIALSIEIARREEEILSRLDLRDGYSLYVGIPFCPSICAYCSFSSSPAGQWAGRIEEYLGALEREIAFAAEAFGHRKLNAIYIGGGTPTSLSAGQLDRLLSCIGESFDFAHLREYTVEAGRPDSVTEGKLAALRRHGVTRISINPQTMRQETLDLIGRRHTPAQVRESFALARGMGFGNINMDLIVGLPSEGISDVRETMRQVAELGPDSLTIHSLARKRSARVTTSPEDYAGTYMENVQEAIEMAGREARGMGLRPYYLYRQKNIAGNLENIGYAAPGKEGIYNCLIMEEEQDIVALGAGGISKRICPDGKIVRCENVKEVSLYLEKTGEMIERKRRLFEAPPPPVTPSR